ncbi:MAG TPA: hypothetical protein VGI81_14160 [Tepidisphaeraceae bacterium]|jgi:peptidoglycan/LPS O-acetylase OafA/YrhL
MSANYYDNPAFWRAFFHGLGVAFTSMRYLWLFLPQIIAAGVIVIRRLLPRWRRTHVMACLLGLAACASLLWERDVSQFVTPRGIRAYVFGVSVLFIAILMQMLGDETDQEPAA